MNNNRKSPSNQQRMKSSHAISVPHSNRMRSNSSMGSSYPKKTNSHTTSPTALSASSSPAVPLFYSNVYADPPECSALPQPPESWYLTTVDEVPTAKIIEEIKEKPQEKSTRKPNYKKNHKGFYSPFYNSARNYNKFPALYVSVKA
ncbi:unnamed protein product [Adineta ricciae]|uniref:Uncharacterized protein n=1 Tax=Adineta ricciae TaxID=249248 RepID=A0A815IYH9_ADIRI|nr:unnamed protein product [Adineta ricciae]CAF1369717.1 unnamed protein product [Adineta ricciae]